MEDLLATLASLYDGISNEELFEISKKIINGDNCERNVGMSIYGDYDFTNQEGKAVWVIKFPEGIFDDRP